MPHLSLLKRVPRHLRHLQLEPEQLRALQRTRLRELLRVAQRRSAFHARRLQSVDPETFELDQLSTLPTMTKDEVLDEFDALVTDREVTLERAFAHLRETDGNGMMNGQYKVVTSAGSSGRVGVWVYDEHAWDELQATNMRMVFRDLLHHPAELLHRPTYAVVAASSPSHLSVQAAQGFRRGWVSVREFPVTMAFPELMKALDEVQPTSLTGYPSVLAELARASMQGELSISPKRVTCSAEPLLDEQRSMMESAWGVAVGNVWASSEAGPMAVGCFRAPGMHLSEDQVIFEPVDDEGRPVPPGQKAAKVYITNLFNHIMPLIRYELDDEITLLDEPCPCGSTLRRIKDIDGRFDEIFEYGHGVKVHSHVIRKALYQLESKMSDYQVFQTERGVQIALRTTGEVDVSKLRESLQNSLSNQGLQSPEVEIDTQGEFRRLPSGKLKRNVPLGFDGFEDSDEAQPASGEDPPASGRRIA